ncbi:MAG: DtxR family transcriptional regulator, partial [Ignavibacteria bacterium]|nr:DtxR family transcriptional regulator [Ignavibacteria bacterium]
TLHPGTALAIAGVLIAVCALILWPESGLVARWRRARRNTRRVLIEDALKHLYDCEYKKLSCTVQSLAGALSISSDEASMHLARLASLGLVRPEGEGSVLTEEGRSYALRIIRIHRLWERYLADETGLQETEWHPTAEELEHKISTDEADALAAQMGDPRYDPHGDPIPTANGDLPRRQGEPITRLSEGDIARIVHIEDEPQAVYAQLVAQGLFPGEQIRILSKSDEKIRYEAGGVENILAPTVAANVTAVRVVDETEVEGPFETLASLRPGETATVVGISRASRGQQRRRLMDLGVLPGTQVSAELRSAGGDPTAYLIRGALIALRDKQASTIHISRNERKDEGKD